MHSAHDVAAALLARHGAMSTMQLEKLVYYCQAWHLVHFGHELFPEQIQAWEHGPVVREIWDAHRGTYGVHNWPKGNASALDANESTTVDWVLAQYGKFSAERLSRMTHMEGPWRIARGGLPDHAWSKAPIRPELLRHYYSRQVLSVDDAVSHAAANAAIEGVELDDEWQEQLRRVAADPDQADAVIAEVIARYAQRDS